MKYNANATSCETFTYGEVEDYKVLLSRGARTELGLTNKSLTVFPNPANKMVNVRLEKLLQNQRRLS
ncbi:MAG: bacillolysin [Sphingobacteriales bacterium]|jgi:bacillolysin